MRSVTSSSEPKMLYREPTYLLELVAVLCALPLVLAYRLEGGRAGAPETLAWFALCWAFLSAARTCWTIKRRHGARQVAASAASLESTYWR
jgi:hypothetical protein